jgi:uncharacterized membrane protein
MQRPVLAACVTGDWRPYLALAVASALLALAVAAPASRAWLAGEVVAPLVAQAEPGSGGATGYTLGSLLFWAAVGLVLSWVAYDLAFRRLRHEPDFAFFAALGPWLLAAPLGHALVVRGALPLPWAFLSTEPTIYATAAVLVLLCLGLGRAWGGEATAFAIGAVALVALALVAAPLVTLAGLGRAALLVALAIASAAVVSLAYVRLARPAERFRTVALVVAAHALDGATTWMVLRDPLGLGFVSFGEQNPVSSTLVQLSDGWPYFAVKLALPLVLLAVLKGEQAEARARAFLLFAVFVLGYGPGTANLLQVMMT